MYLYFLPAPVSERCLCLCLCLNQSQGLPACGPGAEIEPGSLLRCERTSIRMLESWFTPPPGWECNMDRVRVAVFCSSVGTGFVCPVQVAAAPPGLAPILHSIVIHSGM